MESLSWLAGLCSLHAATRGGLLLGLFVAGAAGSVMHCAPMCGAFVLGQVSERMARLPAASLCEWRRIGNGVLWPYHLGRVTTYAVLGSLAAESAAVLARAAWFVDLSAVLLASAAVLFLVHALRRVAPGLMPVFAWLDRPPRAWSRAVTRVTRSLPSGSTGGGLLLGLALGLLPCGFLYAALLTAAATGQPAYGAAAMVAFGLGTVPALVVVGIAGQAAGRRWHRGVTMAAPVIMALNAALLLVLAWREIAA